jgi:hypothetical protein
MLIGGQSYKKKVTMNSEKRKICCLHQKLSSSQAFRPQLFSVPLQRDCFADNS